MGFDSPDPLPGYVTPRQAERPLAYFLPGDSYPADSHVEEALARRLEPAGVEMVAHASLLARAGAGSRRHPIGHRLDQLDALLAHGDPGRPRFLIGRSSGAVVATLAACRRQVAGVVCLSYPFREPGRALDPGRFSHLADLKTRTLLIQGHKDRYGDRSLTEHYALSPAISPRFVAGRHRLDLSEPQWDLVGGWILAFMAGRPLPPIDDFDEAFYLKAHPDVAEAIAVGRFSSGREHFEQAGRAERRAYRLCAVQA